MVISECFFQICTLYYMYRIQRTHEGTVKPVIESVERLHILDKIFIKHAVSIPKVIKINYENYNNHGVNYKIWSDTIIEMIELTSD